MARIQAHRIAVAGHALVKVLEGKMLMASQSVGVSEAGIQLQRSLEEFEGRIVILKINFIALLPY